MLSRIAAVITVAVFTLPSAAAAQEWPASAWTKPTATSTAKPAKSARKAKATRTAAVATPRAAKSSKQTFRAARFDDAKPSLQRRTAAPVTAGSEYGIASYYWQPQPVASGGRFNPEALTAAHKTLPFGTRVRVTRADNGRSVEVTINDRGPFIAGRIIDLSRRAARDIGMTDIGITRVSVSVLGR